MTSKQEVLIFVSETHRSEFNRRRVYEWKVLLATLTLYVLALAGRLSGRFQIPDEDLAKAVVWGVCVGLALVTSIYLSHVHAANGINKALAETAERALINNADCLPLKTLLNQIPASARSGVSAIENLRKNWSWLWQIMVVFCMAFVAAFWLTHVGKPDSLVSGNAAGALLRGVEEDVLEYEIGLQALLLLFGAILGVLGTLAVSYVLRRNSYRQGAYTERAKAVQDLLARGRVVKDACVALHASPRHPNAIAAVQGAKEELLRQAYHHDVWISEARGVQAIRDFNDGIILQQIQEMETRQQVDEVLNGLFDQLREALRKDLGFSPR